MQHSKGQETYGGHPDEKKRARYVINGKFLCEPMQGIVRYAREMTKALDEMPGADEFELVAPTGVEKMPLERIKQVFVGNRKGIAWEQIDYRRYLRRNKSAISVNFCNTTPLFVQPGITTVHDVMYKTNSDDYTTTRNRISRVWHMLQYSYIARHELAIMTDSEFSKSEIERCYPKAEDRISVVPCAWQHVLEYECSQDWQERFPFLIPGKFIFSMATLSRNKNGRWVVEAARQNPKITFALAGRRYDSEIESVPENLHLLGFVSDADACALIKNCKAFVFPSLCEGFGLPPLEALALGADVISSDTTSLPEVLGESVHYVNPKNYHIDIEEILSTSVGDARETLDKYSWHKSARKLLDVVRGLSGPKT